MLYILCCPNFGLLLWFFTIVTISRFEMLNLMFKSAFYHDFILLTCILWPPVRLVELVVLFSSWSRIFLRGCKFAVGGECDLSLVVRRSCNVILHVFCP